MKKEVLVEVFFTTEPDVSVKRQDATALAERVRGIRGRKGDIVPPDAGIEEMREQFPELVEQLSSNPLPWALEIKPRKRRTRS